MENKQIKAAIMQPYLFPYVGYFQLISSVDKFVLYDDVQWMKGGWINRHTCLLNNQEKIISLSVAKHSTFSLIKEVSLIPASKMDYLNKLKNAYQKAPHFKAIFPVIEKIINNEENNISKLILISLQEISNLLEIDTKFLLSSDINYDRTISAQEKLVDITKQVEASIYVNTIRGKDLYNKQDFSKENLSLLFLDRVIKPYKQFKNEFVPYLSIIDVLMFNGIEETCLMVKEFNLK